MAKSTKTTESASPAIEAPRRDKPVADDASATVDMTGDSAFPIVGIGASAGGLEALMLFLGHVPADSNMAFVIIQHLDPTHKGMMPELLQRSTKLVVYQAKNRMRVKRGCIYVIPPNKDMSILHGVLHLLDPAAPRGLRLPIDFFFRSLAADQRERSIGVILSGMGSDGALGLRAIKEKAGLVLVQEPLSAKFDGMPRSAIDAGLADIIAPPEELPGNILAYLQHTHLPERLESALESKNQSALEKVVILLRERTGNDFSLYKKNTLYRRIERRMGIHQIDTIANDGRWFKVRIMPYRTLENVIDGVVITFTDITVAKKLEAALREKIHVAGLGGE